MLNKLFFFLFLVTGAIVFVDGILTAGLNKDYGTGIYLILIGIFNFAMACWAESN